MECVRDKAVVWLAAAVVESLRVGSSVGGVSHVCVCVCSCCCTRGDRESETCFLTLLLSSRDGRIEAEVTSGKFRLIINVSGCGGGLLVGDTRRLRGTLKEETAPCFHREIKRCWRLTLETNLLPTCTYVIVLGLLCEHLTQIQGLIASMLSHTTVCQP